ncbi:MAG: NAD(P)-dependent oxidoreductase [Acidobacteriota bacterium]
MPRVFVAADVGASLLDRILADERFDTRYEVLRSHDELVDRVGDAEALVTRHHNRVDSSVFAAAPELRLLAQGTSGLDNIDLAAADRNNVTVLGLPGQNANAVAELVLAHMIALTRSVAEYNEMVRAGKWERDSCVQRRELRSYTLGIVGLGRVGGRVATIARHFGVAVTAYDPYLREPAFADREARRSSTLEELLASSEILTLHVPLTEETRGMIGAAQLDSLPSGAFVINTCRGPVLDLQALFDRIDDHRIAGAALDVYDPEPPEGLRWPDRTKLILTPHIAGCSRESKASIGAMLYDRICKFFGLEPRTAEITADEQL